MPSELVTGLFGLGGVLLGGMLAVVGPWIAESHKNKAEKKKRRVEKLEELVAALYEHKHWLGKVRSIRVIGVDGVESDSPFSKVEAIATAHFPHLRPKIGELDATAEGYEHWMLEAGQKRLATGKPDTSGMAAVYKPYAAKLREVLRLAEDYAKAEFR